MILNLIIYTFSLLLVSSLLVWIVINTYLHLSKTSLYRLNKFKDKKILVILAHPDDEAMSCSGTLTRLSKISKVRVIVLTKGEKGQEGMKTDFRLKEIREKELKHSLGTMQINNYDQFDLGDNKLKDKYNETRDTIENEIERFKPDLIITHDPSGLYGHSDHMAISKIVKTLQSIYRFNLWYFTLPVRVLNNIEIKNEAGNETSLQNTPPNIRIFTLFQLLKKIHIVYGYKSQRESFAKTFPLKFIPLWFYTTLTPFEYFKDESIKQEIRS